MERGENKCRLSESQSKCPVTRNENFFKELILNDRKRKNDNLIIYHQNVRSLSSKKDEFSSVF